MLIRTELVGEKLHSNTFDGIVEAVADLTAETRLARMAPGSMMYCLSDGKVYVKTSAGSWEAAT